MAGGEWVVHTSAPGFIFNCSLQFFMVMSPLPPFQNNRLSVFASLAAFHFRGLFLKRLLLQPNGFSASLNTARHQAGLRFQGLAPNERPNHTEEKDGSVLLHQTQPVVYILKHNHTHSFSVFPLFFSFQFVVLSTSCHDSALLQPDLIKVDFAAALFSTDL